jgi:hypothetical protein
MTQCLVDSTSDQLVLITDLERNRPGTTQVPVRAIKQCHGGDQEHRPDPGLGGMKRIGGKFWLIRQNVDQWDHEQPSEGK